MNSIELSELELTNEETKDVETGCGRGTIAKYPFSIFLFTLNCKYSNTYLHCYAILKYWYIG
jgi:hypothetical protein